jgi:hypothetical protein
MLGGFVWWTEMRRNLQRLTLIWIVKTSVVTACTGLIWLWIGTSNDCCEHGNEHSGSQYTYKELLWYVWHVPTIGGNRTCPLFVQVYCSHDVPVSTHDKCLSNIPVVGTRHYKHWLFTVTCCHSSGSLPIWLPQYLALLNGVYQGTVFETLCVCMCVCTSMFISIMYQRTVCQQFIYLAVCLTCGECQLASQPFCLIGYGLRC